MDKEQQDMRKLFISVAEMRKDISYIKEFIENADGRYAAKPVEKLVYGLVGIVLIAFASAIMAGVIKAAEYIIK